MLNQVRQNQELCEGDGTFSPAHCNTCLGSAADTESVIQRHRRRLKASSIQLYAIFVAYRELEPRPPHVHLASQATVAEPARQTHSSPAAAAHSPICFCFIASNRTHALFRISPPFA